VTAMRGANKRRRACYRHMRHRPHGGAGSVRPDEEAPTFTTTAVQTMPCAEQRDELPVSIDRIVSVSTGHGRFAGYRMGRDQSAGIGELES
jgi:hypothetical protein